MIIAIIGSSGGHLTELLRLSDMLQRHETFVITNDLGRIVHSRQYSLPIPPFTHLRILRACWITFQVLRQEKPDVILSTGAELAIPAFWMELGLRTKGIALHEHVASFRRAGESISDRHYHDQFAEELEIARRHTGPLARAMHKLNVWGITSIYTLLGRRGTAET